MIACSHVYTEKNYLVKTTFHHKYANLKSLLKHATFYSIEQMYLTGTLEIFLKPITQKMVQMRHAPILKNSRPLNISATLNSHSCKHRTGSPDSDITYQLLDLNVAKWFHCSLVSLRRSLGMRLSYPPKLEVVIWIHTDEVSNKVKVILFQYTNNGFSPGNSMD